jgi:hypothetical protein
MEEVWALVANQQITVRELERWTRLCKELSRLSDQALLQSIVAGDAQNVG